MLNLALVDGFSGPLTLAIPETYEFDVATTCVIGSKSKGKTSLVRLKIAS